VIPMALLLVVASIVLAAIPADVEEEQSVEVPPEEIQPLYDDTTETSPSTLHPQVPGGTNERPPPGANVPPLPTQHSTPYSLQKATPPSLEHVTEESGYHHSHQSLPENSADEEALDPDRPAIETTEN
jgi:hypothetical protein